METIVGTPYYVAPEVLLGQYGKECDCWSLGVLLYIILSGNLPFAGQNQMEVFGKVKRGEYTFDHPEFQSVSKEAKELISKLLTVDLKKRFTCAQALQHKWFKLMKDQGSGNSKGMNLEIFQNLREYKGVSNFRKEALNVLVKMLNEKEINHLRQIFWTSILIRRG